MSDVRYLGVAETARLIRPFLKAAWPGVKFSVRSDSYSGGASIRVRWTDGPTTKQVDAVVKPFEGARFDGMIDLKSGVSTWFCPEHGARPAETYGHSYASENGPVLSRCCAQSELVHMGADYVFTERKLSPEFEAEMIAELERKTGESYDPQKRVWDEWMSTLLYRHWVDVEGPDAHGVRPTKEDSMAVTPARKRTTRRKPVPPPEVAEADTAVIPGEPENVDRCETCRGFGLVRGEGKRAGGPYRTQNGAQEALANGRAKDCPTCQGTGVTGLVA